MWELVHTVSCAADVRFAWAFWTDVANWATDPAIDQVRIEPGFVPGARGTTVTRDGDTVRWSVTEVGSGRTARIEIPAPGAALHISWTFQPAAPTGSTLVQRMHLSGDRAAEYQPKIDAALEPGVPAGMRALADAIAAAYTASHHPEPSRN